MGIEVLALSLPSPASQWERLSSCQQASTRGTIEIGSSELRFSSSTHQKTLAVRGVLPAICLSKFSTHHHGGQLTCIRPRHWKPVVSGCYPTLWPSSISKRPFERYASSSEAVVTSTSSAAQNSVLTDNERVGVLLLNLGGPETLDDVQPFLFNLFADPDIIRLPRLFRFLQKPLAQFISISRAPKSKEGYASIGGGSPLRQITDAQAEALRKALCDKNVPAKVYVGMRYWHPFTEEAIEQVLVHLCCTVTRSSMF